MSISVAVLFVNFVRSYNRCYGYALDDGVKFVCFCTFKEEEEEEFEEVLKLKMSQRQVLQGKLMNTLRKVYNDCFIFILFTFYCCKPLVSRHSLCKLIKFMIMIIIMINEILSEIQKLLEPETKYCCCSTVQHTAKNCLC